MVPFLKASRINAGVTPLALLTVLLGLTSHVQAQTQTLYSDTSTFSGFAYQNGGATGTGTISTKTVADDITLAGPYTNTITGVTFSVANLGATATSARTILSFYSNNGTGGGPGTLLNAIIFNPITFTAGQVALFTYNPGTPIFTFTGSTFWVGETFDNGGTASATTAAGLNALGEGLYNPPTVGSSQDVFFNSTNTGSSTYAASNPAGGFLYFGGTPRANFGFSFTGTVFAPEPTAAALALSGGLLTFGGFIRRRRHSAA